MKSEKLQLNFEKLKNGSIKFEDGVVYNNEEVKHLNQHKYSTETMQTIHLYKKCFNGTLMDARKDNTT